MKRYLARHHHRLLTRLVHRRNPHRLRLPMEQREAPHTEFRALWGATRLHFRFDCMDGDLVPPDVFTTKERVIGSERVEIFFAPDLSLKPY